LADAVWARHAIFSSRSWEEDCVTSVKSVQVAGHIYDSLLSLQVNSTSKLEIFDRKICESSLGIFGGL